MTCTTLAISPQPPETLNPYNSDRNREETANDVPTPWRSPPSEDRATPAKPTLFCSPNPHLTVIQIVIPHILDHP
jgi:hypothetical protein